MDSARWTQKSINSTPTAAAVSMWYIFWSTRTLFQFHGTELQSGECRLSTSISRQHGVSDTSHTHMEWTSVYLKGCLKVIYSSSWPAHPQITRPSACSTEPHCDTLHGWHRFVEQDEQEVRSTLKSFVRHMGSGERGHTCEISGPITPLSPLVHQGVPSLWHLWISLKNNNYIPQFLFLKRNHSTLVLEVHVLQLGKVLWLIFRWPTKILGVMNQRQKRVLQNLYEASTPAIGNIQPCVSRATCHEKKRIIKTPWLASTNNIIITNIVL